MNWRLSHRFDPEGVALADKHYNRRKVGSPQFVPPGACLVFIRDGGDAVWTTSNPLPEYVRHEWAGAWVNTLFRNESNTLSSELITQAVAASRTFWEPPPLGIVTFVDATKVRSTNPGFCYLMAGWKHVGFTKGGLHAFQQLPDEMPEPIPPIGHQKALAV